MYVMKHIKLSSAISGGSPGNASVNAPGNVSRWRNDMLLNRKSPLDGIYAGIKQDLKRK